jgi:hypothetical protein
VVFAKDLKDRAILAYKAVHHELCIHLGYEHDGRLVHTEKKTGMQVVSIYTWPSLRRGREALANAFGKIEWEKLKKPSSAAI